MKALVPIVILALAAMCLTVPVAAAGETGAGVVSFAPLVMMPSDVAEGLIGPDVTSPSGAIGGGSGYYSISSSPSGASVVFDGQDQGVTPVTVEVSSTGTPGHTLSVSKEGYLTYQTTLSGNPAAGETRYVNAQLIPVTTPPTSAPIGGEKAYFRIISSPSGANVEFDGQEQGLSPVTVEVPALGTPEHYVRVTKDGYYPWEKNIPQNPSPGQTITVNADLVFIPITQPPTTVVPGGDKGYYYIDSSPRGASVTFDGQSKGSTPVTVSVPVTGTPGHSISISMPGYVTWTTKYQGNPAPDQTINVFASLNPVNPTGTIYVSSSPSGAYASLDNGLDSLTTPGTFYSVQTGYHTVKVSLAGYQPYYATVQVSQGSQANVYANLNQNPSNGGISVSSTPQGAGVRIDGIYEGESPVVVGKLAPGAHTLTLYLAGYQNYQSTVTVNSGSITYVNAQLVKNSQPTTGDIQVSSTPSGASVYLNGDIKGTTPQNDALDIVALAPGTYTIRLAKAGYNDYTTSVQVTAGGIAQVTATLVPSGTGQGGTLSVSSSPTSADVYLDNQYKGITPVTLSSIPAGSHTVKLSLAGYNDYVSNVQIADGQTTQVSAALGAAPTSTPTQSGPLPLAAVLSVSLVSGLFFMKRRR